MLHKQQFIAPVGTIVKKQTEKIADDESKREERRQKFVDASYSTGIRSALSSAEPIADILHKQTNKSNYSEK